MDNYISQIELNGTITIQNILIPLGFRIPVGMISNYGFLCIKDGDFNGTINIKIYQFHLYTEFLLVRYQMMDSMDNGRNTADALLSH